MEKLLANVTMQISKSIYLKDPLSSDLGMRIIEGSIDLLDEVGFECFTFRKLAANIGSTEASIYRYFENKHKLLLYLSSWYWSWLEYRLVFSLANIASAEARLAKAIRIVTEQVDQDSSFSHINEVKLNRIVIADSAKAYLTREVDQDNEAGVFAAFKQLVDRIGLVILEINPNYKYPHMLVSTVIEGTHHQRYFAEHLPRLTDIIEGEDATTEFSIDMVFKAIKN
jgi:AcrR family transcriptional regulator